MEINNLETLASFIQKTRKAQHLTQADVAAACGVGVRYIVDLEKGKETCQIGKAIKIINMLGIKLDVE